jgi:hypothetical protein
MAFFSLDRSVLSLTKKATPVLRGNCASSKKIPLITVPPHRCLTLIVCIMGAPILSHPNATETHAKRDELRVSLKVTWHARLGVLIQQFVLVSTLRRSDLLEGNA